MSVFGEFGKWADTPFGTSVVAGLLVLVIDLFLTITGVGWITSWLEKRRWKKSRQMLACVLHGSMGNRVNGAMKNFRAILFEKDGKTILNGSIELHLSRLELSLGNLNAQMLVHLPAALPPITEKLSEMTRDISILREHVLSCKLYLSNLHEKIKWYDSASSDLLGIDIKHFNRDKSGVHLRPHAPLTDSNYLFMSIVQIYIVAIRLSASIVEFFLLHSDNLKNLTHEKSAAEQASSYLEVEMDKARLELSKIEESGIYLVRYAPTDLELDGR
jgi:hypothetical protein